MPRVIIAALAVLTLLLTAASAWAQAAQSGSYTPPPRGAPEGRVGGASRDISTERRVALVIGNGAYQHLPRLNNPASDAQLMAATLKSLGFDLVEGRALTDIDRAGFERAIREFGAKLGSGGVGLFYYAGHGVQVQAANYLAPVGANPTGTGDVDFELVNADLVLKQMEAAGSRLNFVILDACRNNPLGGGGLRSLGSGLAQMRAPTGTLVSYATQPGNVAMDGINGHSPYTLALVDAMRRPGLGVFEVFNTAAVTVKNTTGGQQQPWVSNSPIEGNFYFLGPTTVTITPSPAAPPQPDAEVVFWQSILNSNNPADFDEYLRRYSNGQFAGLARNRIGSLRTPTTSAREPQQPLPPTNGSPISLSTIKQFALGHSIPLPSDLQIQRSAAGVPSEFARFIGGWGGDSRWNDRGRQMLLLITVVDAAGKALVLYGDGPPNPSTYTQLAPGWFRTVAVIRNNSLEWDDNVGFHHRFTLIGNDQLFGEMWETVAHVPRFSRSTITISRLN